MAGSSIQQTQAGTAAKVGKADLHDGPPPSALLLALELRAVWEFGALLPSWHCLAARPRETAMP